MKLENLIKYLTDIYNENGNLDVAIIREGEIFSEIELYVTPDDGNLYIEAYKKKRRHDYEYYIG